MDETIPPTYHFHPMRLRDALAVRRWRYAGEYAIYDLGLFTLLIAVLVDVTVGKQAGISFFGVTTDADGLMGIASYAHRGEDVEIGLGLRPDLTGRGLGPSFVRAITDLGRELYHPRTFSLTVATFNHRAITTYERAGFIASGATRPTTFHGKRYTELLMSRPAEGE